MQSVGRWASAGVILLCSLLAAQDVAGWGDTRHHILCEIAFQELTPQARARVIELLRPAPDFMRFSKACTWPDHPRRRGREPFVNLPRAAASIGDNPCPLDNTCVVTAIDADVAVLSQASTSEMDKLAALKYLGHWVHFAMALVHETLYQTEDLGRFNLAEYIATLSRQLARAYGAQAQRIAVRLELAEVTLPLDMAVPCGLILNELLSNSLQHAFPGGRAGAITVTLSHAADRVSLVVRDNGCGFPEHLDFRQTESLGLHLVCALTAQLQGTLTLERDGGTAFTVTFPLPSGQGDEES